MIELAQHIEVLLTENDCVIVPGLGGFMAHYTPSTYIKEEHLFLPPSRTIGFNPQLKFNDGILVQSYMSVYGIGFSEATRIVEKAVSGLTDILYTEGKVNLKNIGELRYNIYGTYEFIPCRDKVISSALYGLPSFEMRVLSDESKKKEKVLVPIRLEETKKRYEMHPYGAYLRNAVAMIAAIVLFFAFSTKVENTDVQSNYAQLLPGELFEQIEKQSVAFTLVPTTKVTPQQPQKSSAKATPASGKATQKPTPATSRPITVKEVKVNKPQPTPAAPAVAPTVVPTPTPAATVKKDQPTVSHPYHIIVAGGIGVKAAETLAAQLKAKGFAEARVLNTEGKVRVSLRSFGNREEATRQLLELRKDPAYKDAWLLAK